MRTIRISEAVWAHLEQHARPFVDSPNDVLERLFQLIQSATSAPATTTASGLTTQRAFRQPIVDALRTLGGRAHKNDVMTELERTMSLTKEDRETDSRGRTMWKQRAAWERLSMRSDGLLQSPQRGIWELAEKRVSGHAA
jgi:hypothetical protein